jgi:hypothetical protein
LIRVSTSRQITRALAVAVSGAVALVGLAIGTGSGTAGATGTCVTGGTGTILMSKSYIHHMLSHHVSITPLGQSSTSSTNTYTITNYAATGGTADQLTGTGYVQYTGGILAMDTITGRKLVLLDIRYDATGSQIYYTVTDGGPIPAFDLGGDVQRTVDGDTQTYTSTKLLMTAGAAAALDSYFETNAFQAGDEMGPGFQTTYTVGACA